MHYVYFLKSVKDGKCYIGRTNNLQQRVGKHNAGKVPSTKYRLPLKLIYYEAFLSEQDAQNKEKSPSTSSGDFCFIVEKLR